MASSMPVPRPVTSAGSWPVSAAMRAADAVVLAMPMSPVTSRSAPARHQRQRPRAMPASMAASACVPAHRRPLVMSAVPWATLCRNRPGASGRSVATPTSTTVTLAPIWRARALTTAPPASEVGHHLGGDLLRPGRHALRVHAVVGGEHRDRGGLGTRRRAAPGNAGQLRAHVLEAAHGPAGLGEQRLAGVCLRGGGPGGRADGREGLAEQGHGQLLAEGTRVTLRAPRDGPGPAWCARPPSPPGPGRMGPRSL